MTGVAGEPSHAHTYNFPPNIDDIMHAMFPTLNFTYAKLANGDWEITVNRKGDRENIVTLPFKLDAELDAKLRLLA
jgi:hypothetical protein